MNTSSTTTRALLQDIGSRVQRERLNQNLTQLELAESAGVSRRGLQNLEQGGRSTLDSLIKVLRALGKIDQLNLLLPDPGLSPIQLARFEGTQRKRASRPRRRQPDAESR